MTDNNFHNFGFADSIMRALTAEGFGTPTHVQSEAIPFILSGKDVLATAQTGSGKTAAFGLPILQKLAAERKRPEPGRPRALILAPTRELAAQIGEVLTTFGRELKVRTATIFGGVGKNPQISALRGGADVLVATPGRLLDLIGDGVLHLDHVKIVVLDEADRMLDMGFIPDVERIVKRLPVERQSLFFSATMPKEVEALARKMLKDPVRVSVVSDTQETPKIDQRIMFVAKQDKRNALKTILTESGSFRALVFTRTKYRARDISRFLGKQGIPADDLHGDKSQNARTRALNNFHSGKIQVLVATDIASRGIDVDDIDHVINFELPNEAESYVHRIGRTARAGKAGIAVSLCDDTEISNLAIIQKAINSTIPVVADHPFHAADVAESAARTGRKTASEPKARPAAQRNRSAGRNNRPAGGERFQAAGSAPRAGRQHDRGRSAGSPRGGNSGRGR